MAIDVPVRAMPSRAHRAGRVTVAIGRASNGTLGPSIRRQYPRKRSAVIPAIAVGPV